MALVRQNLKLISTVLIVYIYIYIYIYIYKQKLNCISTSWGVWLIQSKLSFFFFLHSQLLYTEYCPTMIWNIFLYFCITQAMPSRRLVTAQMLVCGNPSRPSCPLQLTLTLHREDGTGRPMHWMTQHSPMPWTVTQTISTASVEVCRYTKNKQHVIFTEMTWN